MISCAMISGGGRLSTSSSIEISSDGGVKDFLDQTESWNESARSLYSRTFGEPPLEPPGIVGNVNLLH
jgi:hypothetical protein